MYLNVTNQNENKKFSEISGKEKLQWATWFIDHGYAIFPIYAETKKPTETGWQRFSTNELSEEEKKRYLDMVATGYNYAVAGGQRGLVVLDFENKGQAKDLLGEDGLNELCGKTLCVNTPHGGIHIYVTSDDIPEHKFNPVFVKDGKGIADLQSYNSIAIGIGSCINHKNCKSGKCKWKGQDVTTCYTPFNDVREIKKVDLRKLLRFLADRGEEIGIKLTSSAQAWLDGEEKTEIKPEELENLKKELIEHDSGKIIEKIKEETCSKTENKLVRSVICQGKTYTDMNVDRSSGDCGLIMYLMSHGVTDPNKILQLLPADSKAKINDKWDTDKYFTNTLKNAWVDVQKDKWLKQLARSVVPVAKLNIQNETNHESLGKSTEETEKLTTGNGNNNNNLATPNNPNNQTSSEQNYTGISGDIYKNVPNVPVSNLGTDTSEKSKSGTNGTNSYISVQHHVENRPEDGEKLKTDTKSNSQSDEEIEDDDVVVTDNEIIINAGDKHKFEVFYGYARPIEDSKRVINLKVAQLPQFQFVAKKKDEVLKIVVTVDFYQDSDKSIFYIRNKKEVVEKLYAFRGQRHISKKLISDALEKWLDRINPGKYTKWVDVRDVVREYPEWKEINDNPLTFFLSRSSEVIGNEKLKVAVLLSILSSQLARLYGIYRIHLILTGKSGAGKSSTVKSILKLFYQLGDIDDWIILNVTRLTQESLGYMDIRSLDGKVIFVEQLDNIEEVKYLREAMSEDQIKTLVTTKTEAGDLKSTIKFIPGQPAFITTNVAANIDHQILNRSIQLYLDQTNNTKIVEEILGREGISSEELAKLKLVTYVWLKTRPTSPKMSDAVKHQLAELLNKFIDRNNVYRATEITRNMVRATASMFGHEMIDNSDVDFVMRYFKKDIILTTLELSERDLEILNWFKSNDIIEEDNDDETIGASTARIAQEFKMSTKEAVKLLHSIYDRGLLWMSYDGKRYTWALSHYGLNVLAELESEVEGEKKEEESDDPMIKDFEDCLGGSLEKVFPQFYDRSEITEEYLMKLFNYDEKAVNKVEECLPKLGYHGVNGVFKRDELSSGIKTITPEGNNS